MDELSKLFGGAEQAWQYIKKYASKAGREGTRMVLEAFYVVKSPETPTLDKTIIIAALGYQLLPEDLISREKHGLLGLLDNGVAIAMAYKRVQAHITPEITNQVNAIIDQWYGSNKQNESETYSDQTKLSEDKIELTRQESKSHTDYTNNVNTTHPCSPLGFDDDEDVVID